MKNYIINLLFLLLILFSGCQEQVDNQKNSTQNTNTQKKEINTTLGIDFIKFPLDKVEGIVTTKDDGVYRNFDFDYINGETTFYFIPKSGATKWYNSQIKLLKDEDVILNNLNKKTIQELTKEFNLIIFHIDKTYLKATPGFDSPYVPRDGAIIVAYYLEDDSNKYIKIDSLKFNKYDESIDSKWRNKILDKIIRESNVSNKELLSTKVSNKWFGKYSAYFSYGKIGGENAGWQLDIEITPDTIKASGDGYQIGFTDLLNATEDKKQLTLTHLKNLYGYKKGTRMHPEFVLVEDNGLYYIKSDWIDSDIVTKPKKFGYEISKLK